MKDKSEIFFVGFVEIFSEKKVTALRSTVLATYRDHAIILDSLIRQRQWLINNGHTLVWFLSVCCSCENLEEDQSGGDEEKSVTEFTSSVRIELKRGANRILDSVETEQMIRVLCKALNIVGDPL